jgi:uncharacterized membrane protein YozB (DUF420 family)
MEHLPAVNATLNSIAFILLLFGWRAARAGERATHKKFMIAALTTSAAFLTCYLVYHYSGEPTKFTHEGWPKTLYFAILITHVPLAALMVIPIIYLAWMGLTDRIERHRRLARIVMPVWVYVSITGVLIYFMLYQWFPPATA